MSVPGSQGMRGFKREHVYYFDFECSTDGIHKPYCVCYANELGIEGSFYGSFCAHRFLDMVPTNSLCYAHNLSYDICFIISLLDRICDNPIIKDGKTMSLTGVYHRKILQFKDTYAIITTKLARFPTMFHLETGRKEVFPYNYYTSARTRENQIGDIQEASLYVPEAERGDFIENAKVLAAIPGNENAFDMRRYAVFYCLQDIRILKQGFEFFRDSLLSAFGLDAYDFVSISSIANRYMELNCYYPNGNLFDLSNKPRDFMARCIIGGRCMLADNKKRKTEEPIVDFDAVSLYPSAMYRLYTLEGMPKVLAKDQCHTDYLLSKLFLDDQIEPTEERFISGFFVHAMITKIGKPRHFPLIVYNKDLQLVSAQQDDPKTWGSRNWKDAKDSEPERSDNVCCEMYLDHIMLQDLIAFQECEIRVLRGYYYDGKRDLKIRECIHRLFELRLQYKKENNPLQEIIKLLLNSIYGKTILKPINTTIKFVQTDKLTDYIRRRYNQIESTETIYTDRDVGCKFTETKEVKTINKHFNFTPLGVNILSMSKRIMNEVICLAEDNEIPVYYQDTDSIHIRECDLQRLADLYGAKYNRALIGKALGQFHSDFACIGDSKDMPVAIRSIFVGKKTYIDMLYSRSSSSPLNSASASCSDIAFHCRAKGIPTDVLVITANNRYPDSNLCVFKDGLVYPLTNDPSRGYSIFMLYEALHDGEEIEFNLCDGLAPCFDMKGNFSIETKAKFTRRLKF